MTPRSSDGMVGFNSLSFDAEGGGWASEPLQNPREAAMEVLCGVFEPQVVAEMVRTLDGHGIRFCWDVAWTLRRT